MDMNNFIDTYFNDFKNVLENFLKIDKNKLNLNKCIEILKTTKINDNNIFIIGNGGSSAIADHMAIDFTKNAGLRAFSLTGSPTITTFANDFGYENMFQKSLEHYCKKGDVIIAISGTGTSKNILKACEYAKNNNMDIISFSGFEKDNPLSKKGDINFWIESKAFGYLEIIHNLLIHYICDAIIGKSEYMIR
jgi:D-sedoheptulose 7-phosphate isomerase